MHRIHEIHVQGGAVHGSMTIGIGYFIGCDSILCFHEAIRKPEALFKLTKAKIVAMKKIDEFVQKFLMDWASIALLAGTVVFVIVYMNALSVKQPRKFRGCRFRQ